MTERNILDIYSFSAVNCFFICSDFYISYSQPREAEALWIIHNKKFHLFVFTVAQLMKPEGEQSFVPYADHFSHVFTCLIVQNQWNINIIMYCIQESVFVASLIFLVELLVTVARRKFPL